MIVTEILGVTLITEISRKIESSTPDYICVLCPQEYRGVCRAFQYLILMKKRNLERNTK